MWVYRNNMISRRYRYRLLGKINRDRRAVQSTRRIPCGFFAQSGLEWQSYNFFAFPAQRHSIITMMWYKPGARGRRRLVRICLAAWAALAGLAALNGWLRMVRFENVGVRYGVGPEILRDINLHIEPGSFHFLTGASGAGKSSLLKLMYLGLFPTRGNMEVFGKNIGRARRRDLPALRRRIGVVFQDFRLLKNLSVFDNVALPLRLAGEDEKRTRNNVSELLDWVGLGARLADGPDTLSGGEQQRVAIARAVISKPSLLLADEPTGNVDDRIAYRLVHLFEELHRSGTAVVVATHNDALVRRFSHPVLALNDSVLQASPPPTATGNGPRDAIREGTRTAMSSRKVK